MRANLMSGRVVRSVRAVLAGALVAGLAACGGGGGGSEPSGPGGPVPGAPSGLPDQPASQRDAVRLADQASFGPTEALLATIRTQGATKWLAQQMTLTNSRYSSGGDQRVHQHTSQNSDFCTGRGDNCWRDWYSSTPLVWDFYRNAVQQPDQLRQRVAFALQQILVVSAQDISGTYGLRSYHNALLANAFGNYRDILRKVTLSPVMGDYLDHVNNDPEAPNENFARELLQLFAIGTCELNPDGSMKGGHCTATYDNDTVRAYAYALTGWTYPAGGATPWGCWPRGTNCQFYSGDMVALPAAFHNSDPQTLLAGVWLPAGQSASQALEAVLDSLMNHPNIAPFIGKQLIQHLVSSNPSPAYVQRVAQAFNTGRFGDFGSGQRGDMKATVAAVLLDAEARGDSPGRSAGRLREPALLFTGVLRALNGRTDGDALGWWWGETLQQHVFRPPSVFNFYSPDYPVAGTSLVGPAFGIHNANTALQRINFVHYLTFWNGSEPSGDVPNALGTRLNLTTFLADADRPDVLVDRLSHLALGAPLPAAARTAVVNAVSAFPWPASGSTDAVRRSRVQQAAYLVFASPQYQIAR
jgi:hypothetical protein